MKKLILSALIASPLLLAAPACSTLHEILDVPGAVAEDIGGVIYGPHGASVSLKSPPKGRTMLGWTWEPSLQRGQLVHTTPSGILVFAPEFSR